MKAGRCAGMPQTVQMHGSRAGQQNVTCAEPWLAVNEAPLSESQHIHVVASHVHIVHVRFSDAAASCQQSTHHTTRRPPIPDVQTHGAHVHPPGHAQPACCCPSCGQPSQARGPHPGRGGHHHPAACKYGHTVHILNSTSTLRAKVSLKHGQLQPKFNPPDQPTSSTQTQPQQPGTSRPPPYRAQLQSKATEHSHTSDQLIISGLSAPPTSPPPHHWPPSCPSGQTPCAQVEPPQTSPTSSQSPCCPVACLSP